MEGRALREYRLVLKDAYFRGAKITAIEYQDSDSRVVGESVVANRAISLARELGGELLMLKGWDEEFQEWNPIVITTVST